MLPSPLCTGLSRDLVDNAEGAREPPLPSLFIGTPPRLAFWLTAPGGGVPALGGAFLFKPAARLNE